MTCQPYDVAENDNKLYVVHGSPNGITVIDKTTGASQTCNIGSVQLSSCYGIAEREGNIHVYVADSCAHCVYKFTTDGRLLTKFGSYGSSAGQLSNPRGLRVSTDGTVYVTEGSNERISVFNHDGTFIRHIPVGEATPWGIAIDGLGILHVHSTMKLLHSTCRCIHMVSLWTKMGSFTFVIPKTGEYSNTDEWMMSLRVLIVLHHKQLCRVKYMHS